MKPTREGYEDAAKQKKGQGLRRGHCCVLQSPGVVPEPQVYISGSELKPYSGEYLVAKAALMFMQVFRLILVECLTPKNCTLYWLQGEQGLYSTCFDLQDSMVILVLKAHSHVLSKPTI